jgi:rare lipoprotein A
MSRSLRLPAALLIACTLAACGSTPRQGGSAAGSAGPSSTPRGGGYYLDDGPGADAPANLDAIPDAVPKAEPLHRGTQRPYVVMGRSYTPMTRIEPYKARGIATWYGRRYHGKPTSSGEPYDMYAMSAAHTVLPIPSYVRVTNVSNGRSVVVRVNDRGPFIGDRLIDLSYTAAHKLGIIGRGSGMVEVESIIPGVAPAAEPPPVATAKPLATPAIEVAALPPVPPATPSAVTPAAPAVASGTAGAGSGGSFIQFGAFGVQANADSFMSRLQSQADWLAGSLRIENNGGVFRVQAGPYPSEAAAREAADRAGLTFGTKPIVVNR